MMALAFLRAGYSVPTYLIQGKSGWNARLSFRTFKQLQNEGYEKFSG